MYIYIYICNKLTHNMWAFFGKYFTLKNGGELFKWKFNA